MTVEELRDFLNELIEENPSCKDKEVKIERWEKIVFGMKIILSMTRS